MGACVSWSLRGMHLRLGETKKRAKPMSTVRMIMGMTVEWVFIPEATHDPFSLFPHGRCLGY